MSYFLDGGAPYPTSVITSDLNGDGNDTRATISLGNGDGTYRAYFSSALVGANQSGTIGDFNNDGKLDFATSDLSTGAVALHLGCGDGRFGTSATYMLNLSTDVAAADFNSDGNLDVVFSEAGGNVVVALGNGNGTLRAPVSYVGTGSVAVAAEDFNEDGIIDIAIGAGSAVGILLGNGNGTFMATRSYVAGTTVLDMVVADFNGDTFFDIATAESGTSTVSVFLGNGNGSFVGRISFSPGGGTNFIATADFDLDGVTDIATYNNALGSLGISLAQTTTGLGALQQFSLDSLSDARQALPLIRVAIGRIASQRATIGAFQSRVGTGIANLRQATENFATAESRLVDVDVAEEAANLVRSRILQQAGAAVLAQANQSPTLALRLLGEL